MMQILLYITLLNVRSVLTEECVMNARSVKGLPTNRGVCDDADTAIYNLAEC